MSNRALPDLVARIRVDSSGVDSAMTSLIGSFGRTQFALAALGASIGLVILAGKSMMDIARGSLEVHRDEPLVHRQRSGCDQRIRRPNSRGRLW
jgi:hypothetical protein